MAMGKRIAGEVIEAIRQDRKAGMPVRKIAEKYHIGKSSVYCYTENMKVRERAVLTAEQRGEMEVDREAGMPVKEIAEKYGVSIVTVYCRTRSRRPRKAVTEEMIDQMQSDRDDGMDTYSIGKKYGISQPSVCGYTENPKKRKRLKEGQKSGNCFVLSNGRVMSPITPGEIEAKRASLRVGKRMGIPVMQYDELGNHLGLMVEQCRVEHVSRHVVVFRRPNGMREHRTLVELCQMGRKA